MSNKSCMHEKNDDKYLTIKLNKELKETHSGFNRRKKGLKSNLNKMSSNPRIGLP